MGQAGPVPPPYDARNFLQLLGIDLPLPDEDRDPEARLTVTHPLIAGTGFLWAPVVVAMADALCAFGVSHHWPEGAKSFTTVDCSANFISSAREGEEVAATAAPLHLGRTTQVWDARDHRAADGVLPLHADHPVLRPFFTDTFFTDTALHQSALRRAVTSDSSEVLVAALATSAS